MYKKVISCQTCLSSDRMLHPIKDLKIIYDVLTDLKLTGVCGGLCWECIAVIKNYAKLREKAARAQKVLTNLSYKQNFVSLSTLTNQSLFIFNSNQTEAETPIVTTNKNCVKIEQYDKSTTTVPYQPYSCDIKHDNDQTYLPEDVKIENDNDAESDDDTPLTKIKRSLVKNNVEKEKAAGKYDCITLSEAEMMKSRQRKASHPNHVSIKYKCDKCIMGFHKQEALDVHMKKKHDPSIGDMSCEICEIRFPNSLHLKLHREKHYQSYRCKLCTYETADVNRVIQHCYIKHTPDTTDEVHCRLCVAVFTCQKDLDEHVNEKHILSCECGIQFKDRSNLRTHIRRIHSKNRDIICDYCKRTFKTKYRLEAHITKHNDALAKKLSYCAICKIQYKNIYIYRSHLKTTSKHVQDGYTCYICKKVFASKVYWKKHYDFFHLKMSNFKCEQCDKIFISYWRLKNHNQTQHGQERTKNHACNVCGKKFFASSTLRAHMLTHSEQRRFMCSECGDTFKQRPALYNHTRLVHKGYTRNKQNDAI